MRPVSNLRQPKEQKQAITANSRKNLCKKSFRGIETQTFH